MKISEFFVELGVNADTKTLKEFTGEIANLSIDAASGIVSLLGLEYHLAKVAAQAMEAAVGFEMFGNQTGLSWQELQKWQIVAQQANVSAEAVASSVSNLQKSMAEIRLGRGNIAPFQMFGIDNRLVAQGNAFQVLLDLRWKMHMYDAATTTNLISQMGLSPEMVNVLKLSNEEFTKFMQTSSGMTKHQEEQFLSMKLAITQFGLAFKEYGIDMVSNFADALSRMGLTIENIKGSWGAWVAMVIALGYAFAPLTTAITLLIVILDDLAGYFNGKKSLTGSAIGGLKDINKNLDSSTGKNYLGSFLKWPLSTLAGNVQPVGYVTNNQFHINVHGSGSPEAIANEVTRQVQGHMSKAEQDFNNQGH